MRTVRPCSLFSLFSLFALLAAAGCNRVEHATSSDSLVQPGADPQALLFVHSVATDAADERRVVPLRLTSIVFGVITVVSAFALTRLLTDDPWSPVLAALVVAFIPKFAFLSGVINNDNLATALASVATVLIGLYIGPRHGERRNAALLITTGVVLGAGLLAKLASCVERQLFTECAFCEESSLEQKL